MKAKRIINLFFLIILSLFVISACSNDSGNNGDTGSTSSTSGTSGTGGSSNTDSFGGTGNNSSTGGTTDTEEEPDDLQEIKNKLVYAAGYATYVAAKYYDYRLSSNRSDTDSIPLDIINQVEEDIANYNNGNVTDATYITLLNNAEKLYIEAQNLLVDYILEYVDANADITKLERTITGTTSNAAKAVYNAAYTTKTTAESVDDTVLEELANYTCIVADLVNQSINDSGSYYQGLHVDDAITNFIIAYNINGGNIGNVGNTDTDSEEEPDDLQEVKNKLVYAAGYTTYASAKYYDYVYGSGGFDTDSIPSDIINQVEEDIANYNNGNVTDTTYIQIFNNAQKLYVEAQNLLVDYILEYVDKNADITKLEYTATDTVSNAAKAITSLALTTQTTAESADNTDLYQLATYTYTVTDYVNQSINNVRGNYFRRIYVNNAIDNFIMAYNLL